MAGKNWTNITRERALDAVRTALAAFISLLAGRALKLPEFYWAPISTLVSLGIAVALVVLQIWPKPKAAA